MNKAKDEIDLYTYSQYIGALYTIVDRESRRKVHHKTRHGVRTANIATRDVTCAAISDTINNISEV